jgi:hypothetical protein
MAKTDQMYGFTFERTKDGKREFSDVMMGGKNYQQALNRAKRNHKERDGWKLANKTS